MSVWGRVCGPEFRKGQGVLKKLNETHIKPLGQCLAHSNFSINVRFPYFNFSFPVGCSWKATSPLWVLAFISCQM